MNYPNPFTNRFSPRFSLWLFTGLLCLPVAGLAQAPKPAQVTTANAAPVAAVDARQQTFQQVWQTVKDKHFDPTFGGVNWDQVRVQYAAKLAGLKSDAELYAMLQTMLGELHQSHFGIVPPEAIVDEPAAPGGAGHVGIELLMLGKQAVISAVVPGSSAAQAGLRPGFVVTHAGKATVAELWQKMQSSQEREPIRRLRLERLVSAYTQAAPGASVALRYLDAQNRPQAVTLTAQAYKGELSPPFGNLGPQPLLFEAKRLPNGMGYIKFNIWVMPMMPKLRAALRELAGVPGLIIDLRGNPGGIGAMSNGISGHLFNEETSLGKMQMRGGFTNFAVFPQKNGPTPIYAGPLAIITNYGSASTSEVFAAGLQDLGRAVVVGETSAGAALPSLIEKLPTGALFQYAIGDFKTAKGTLVEGRGVVPNVPVVQTRDALLAGRDTQLEAASATLQKQLAAPKK